MNATQVYTGNFNQKCYRRAFTMGDFNFWLSLSLSYSLV